MELPIVTRPRLQVSPAAVPEVDLRHGPGRNVPTRGQWRLNRRAQSGSDPGWVAGDPDRDGTRPAVCEWSGGSDDERQMMGNAIKPGGSSSETEDLKRHIQRKLLKEPTLQTSAQNML